ncbi:hypothetical protein GWK47_011209 [Chionoecetes opilio]|uniref:Uncharacterized protein n=1 Tax=Chionoecetes opilio TaxID=41210 RepID=A0A8J4XWQ2_CHIOP|nr:hypothetical protein GWK47_011209 [Chionoecetes opilio]
MSCWQTPKHCGWHGRHTLAETNNRHQSPLPLRTPMKAYPPAAAAAAPSTDPSTCRPWPVTSCHSSGSASNPSKCSTSTGHRSTALHLHSGRKMEPGDASVGVILGPAEASHCPGPQLPFEILSLCPSNRHRTQAVCMICRHCSHQWLPYGYDHQKLLHQETVIHDMHKCEDLKLFLQAEWCPGGAGKSITSHCSASSDVNMLEVMESRHLPGPIRATKVWMHKSPPLLVSMGPFVSITKGSCLNLPLTSGSLSLCLRHTE